jgi:hypothetical protein
MMAITTISSTREKPLLFFLTFFTFFIISFSFITLNHITYILKTTMPYIMLFLILCSSAAAACFLCGADF